MSIRTQDAIACARALIGTPYSELDCINLVKRVIRTSPGGVRGYTTAGTNSLWKSAEMSAKYRDLTWRQEGIDGARAGMLALKRNGSDVHHVGIVAEGGYEGSTGGRQLTVIHSSSVKGGVVETALDGSWQLLAVHRYIEVEGGTRSAGPEGSGGISISDRNSHPLDGDFFSDATFRLPESATGGGRLQSPLDPSGLPYPLETTGAAAPGPRGEGDGGTTGAAAPGPRENGDGRTDGGTIGAAAPGPRGDGGTDGGTEPVVTTLVREDAEGCVMLFGRWRVARD